ncbi:hypothetical protein CRE_28316 [Caenorhabditis remanei]|uniref:Uncharacterized protein n=1 Tax=Caenorhabditis remanei TaxID=31234 RepID=E3LLT1_CAERE|nr:hypothetical protein CRE_28316 [Caenorhabditis remanei]
MSSESLLLALPFCYSCQQLMNILAPIIFETTEMSVKKHHLSNFDSIFLLTVCFASHSQFCMKKSVHLFWLGIGGICHVVFCWMVLQIKSIILLYSLSFFIAIGPVHSICLIFEEEIEKHKSSRIMSSSIVLLGATIYYQPASFLSTLILLTSAFLLQIIDDSFHLTGDYQSIDYTRRRRSIEIKIPYYPKSKVSKVRYHLRCLQKSSV